MVHCGSVNETFIKLTFLCIPFNGSKSLPTNERKIHVSNSDTALLIIAAFGAMVGFATLVVKIIEVARSK